LFGTEQDKKIVEKEEKEGKVVEDEKIVEKEVVEKEVAENKVVEKKKEEKVVEKKEEDEKVVEKEKEEKVVKKEDEKKVEEKKDDGAKNFKQVKNQNEDIITLPNNDIQQNDKERYSFDNTTFNDNFILYACPDCENEKILTHYSIFEKEKNEKYKNGFLCDICFKHLHNEDLLHCENEDCEFDGCLSCLPNAKQIFPKCPDCAQHLDYCHETFVNPDAYTVRIEFICDKCMIQHRHKNFLSCKTPDCMYNLCFQCCDDNEEIIKKRLTINSKDLLF